MFNSNTDDNLSVRPLYIDVFKFMLHVFIFGSVPKFLCVLSVMY